MIHREHAVPVWNDSSSVRVHPALTLAMKRVQAPRRVASGRPRVIVSSGCFRERGGVWGSVWECGEDEEKKVGAGEVR